MNQSSSLSINPTALVCLATAPAPGAIAIIALTGSGTPDLLIRVTGRQTWSPNHLYLCDFAGIDTGLAVAFPLPSGGQAEGQGESGPPNNENSAVTFASGSDITNLSSEITAEIMPHGGPRVVQKLLDHLIVLGATYHAAPSPRNLYPEAGSDLEADMLAALASAASPVAIDLLLAQPALWHAAARNIAQLTSDIRRLQGRAIILDRLLTPPTIVVAGRPNVGKSTLANRMLGRAASIVMDLPGTTRDWVAGRAQIRGVCLRWIDTPGLRESPDPIEQAAIELARPLIAGADCLIALSDPATDWPELPPGRKPDLWVINKCDTAAVSSTSHQPPATSQSSDPFCISALTGQNLDQLEEAILTHLGLDDLQPELWAFCPALKSLLAHPDPAALTRHIF